MKISGESPNDNNNYVKGKMSPSWTYYSTSMVTILKTGIFIYFFLLGLAIWILLTFCVGFVREISASAIIL